VDRHHESFDEIASFVWTDHHFKSTSVRCGVCLDGSSNGSLGSREQNALWPRVTLS
jgi:hypothetical protein